MDRKYVVWIDSNVYNNGYGQCAAITQKMVETFPELKRVRGYYHCPIWGEREHWWCVGPRQIIVDPTAAQFPSKGLGEYVPWNAAHKEPTGHCMNCGVYCYDGNNTCSNTCEHAINVYYNIKE